MAVEIFLYLVYVGYMMNLSELKRQKRLGRATFNTGHYEISLQYFDKALEIDPKDASILEYKGLAHLQLGDLESAERSFDEILKFDPKSLYAHKGKELVEKAREEGVESVKLSPRKVSPLFFAFETAPIGILAIAIWIIITAFMVGVIGFYLTFEGGIITAFGYLLILESVLSIFIAINLIKLKKWAWIVTIVLMLINISIFLASGGRVSSLLLVVISICVLIYLILIRKEFEVGMKI